MPDKRITKEYFPITVKQVEGESVPDGTIAGKASTPGLDRIADIILPAAFEKSIAKLQEKGKLLPMRYKHRDPIGVFKQLTVSNNGLDVVGEINLDVQLGRETYSLIKQGAIDSMSVGIIVEKDTMDDKGVRIIEALELLEITVTDIPVNEEAEITAVKDADTETKERTESWLTHFSALKQKEKDADREKLRSVLRDACKSLKSDKQTTKEE